MTNIKDSEFLRREKKTIRLMMDIYCRKNHQGQNSLSEECSSLLGFSLQRLDHCPWN